MKSTHQLCGALCFALFTLLSSSVSGQSTTRVSVDSNGSEGLRYSERPSLSADGRFVAFHSSSDNLVLNDTNWDTDVFVHNTLTGVTERVSIDSSGGEANGDSFKASISADGRFVAFESTATNLVPGTPYSRGGIFLHDRQTGITEKISIAAVGVDENGSSQSPSISSDGRFVAFSSSSTNLISGTTTDWHQDIFVHDRQTGLNKHVSVDSSGVDWIDPCSFPAISADGRFVAFESYCPNFVPGDTNNTWDIFVHDGQAGITERVSLDSNGIQGNDRSSSTHISGDGRFVVFVSDSDNLYPGDTDSSEDIFVRDRLLGTTEQVSVNAAGEGANAYCLFPSISSDGRYISFRTHATNLDPENLNYRPDIFIHDLHTGVLERVSIDSHGNEGNDTCYYSSLSGDGQRIAFGTIATNLVANWVAERQGIYLHDRWDGLGLNSIYLTVPPAAAVGLPLEFSWQEARPYSDYWLAYSQTQNGSILGGHEFDLGFHQTIIASGTNTNSGTGTFISAPVSSSAAGHTLYFELATRDANGTLYDSKARSVIFY